MRLASSPYVRCVQTLEPLAQALGQEVEPDAALAEGADPSRALTLLRDSGAVVCTHGDVIEAVLDALRGRGLKVEGGDGMKKGAFWIVEVEKARVRYVPPPR